MDYDTSYNSVSLLLLMHGANNSTTFTDNSPTPKTITAVGNAKISTAQSKFGQGSGSFDGVNAYLSVPNVSELRLGTGDFTIETWIYKTAYAGGSYIRDETIYGSNGTGNLLFFLSYSDGKPSTWDGATNKSSTITVPLNQWTHVAFTRAGGTFRIFVNGAKGHESSYTFNCSDSTSQFRIGGNAYLDSSRYLNGNMNGLRITKGIARYTSAFTPPTEAFPIRGPIYKLRGTAQFTDGTIATLARAWRRDTGAFLASATPNPTTGAFEITSANTPCDISIFKDGYRPLTHGPITPIPE